MLRLVLARLANTARKHVLLALSRSDSRFCTAVFFTNVTAGQGRASETSPNQLPVDERPIITRERDQGRAVASSDERYDGGGAYGGPDDVQGSPPKAPPRTLHSGEGSRPHDSRKNQMSTCVEFVSESWLLYTLVVAALHRFICIVYLLIVANCLFP